MEGLLLHGGGVGGGGGIIARGSVESYGIYSVCYTFGLLLRVGLPRGPLLECVYLHGFCVSRSEQHGIYSGFCVFSEGIFFGQVQSYGFYSIIYTSSLLLRVVFTDVFCATRAEKHDFYGVLAAFEKAIFPAGHLSPAALFYVPCRHVTLTLWGGMPVRRLVSTPSLVFKWLKISAREFFIICCCSGAVGYFQPAFQTLGRGILPCLLRNLLISFPPSGDTRTSLSKLMTANLASLNF